MRSLPLAELKDHCSGRFFRSLSSPLPGEVKRLGFGRSCSRYTESSCGDIRVPYCHLCRVWVLLFQIFQVSDSHSFFLDALPRLRLHDAASLCLMDFVQRGMGSMVRSILSLLCHCRAWFYSNLTFLMTSACA